MQSDERSRSHRAMTEKWAHDDQTKQRMCTMKALKIQMEHGIVVQRVKEHTRTQTKDRWTDKRSFNHPVERRGDSRR